MPALMFPEKEVYQPLELVGNSMGVLRVTPWPDCHKWECQGLAVVPVTHSLHIHCPTFPYDFRVCKIGLSTSGTPSFLG